MTLDLLQVSPASLAYVLIGGFVALFSLASLLVKEKLIINEVVLGTAFGVIIGPYCLNIFDPRAWGANTNRLTLEVLRIVLATGLLAIGVALPPKYLKMHLRGLLVLVVPMMAFGWVIVAGFIYAIFPQFNFVSALVISACLTPTDPIISAAIVAGTFALKHVPENLRSMLSAESAANDGLAYPFLSLSLYLTLEASASTAVGKWLLVGCLYQVVLGTILGALLGTLFRILITLSYRHNLTDLESSLAQSIALALLTTGTAYTLGLDDLLAAFAAGVALNWDGSFGERTAGEAFAAAVELLMNCGCFVYIGAWLPFAAYNDVALGLQVGRLVALFAVIAVVRRIPAAVALYRWVPEVRSWKEAVFVGHFGPMGVSAIFVSTMAALKLPAPDSPPQGQAQLLAATIQPVVSFVVLGSVIIHGLSIPFFNMSKDMHARTISLKRTWTRQPPAGPPEWLVGMRRTSEDLERGAPGAGQEKGGSESEFGGGAPEPIRVLRVTDTMSMASTKVGHRVDGEKSDEESDREKENGDGRSAYAQEEDAGSTSSERSREFAIGAPEPIRVLRTDTVSMASTKVGHRVYGEKSDEESEGEKESGDGQDTYVQEADASSTTSGSEIAVQ